MTGATHEPIVTERLILRKLQPSDADAVFDMMRTPATMQYTTRAPLTELHQASTYLSERSGPSMFGVCLKPTSSTPETLIGLLGSVTFPEIGYRFSPSHAGRGYATEALLAFTPALFKMMPAEQKFAVARVDVENVSSLKLLERCGWTKGEVEERAYTSALLGVRDDVCFRIAREGYRLEDVLGQEEDDEPLVPDLQ
ncbi:acyl-CoA N-acyltransferase [Aureobasidium pullulans]|uniref:Acyl-CoA N-acyltransferase n=1 Tax=Aureobasidium pullulans TaxID=5580 RepID=A0A4S9XUQ6_AURPU|nr:acyl-CoA N-acyltransferase [Aureobasidium pullulans]